MVKNPMIIMSDCSIRKFRKLRNRIGVEKEKSSFQRGPEEGASSGTNLSSLAVQKCESANTETADTKKHARTNSILLKW